MTLKISAALTFILFNALSLFALSPVATHGLLKVSQGKIIGSKDNKPVQLAGMSLFWSLWEGERFYNRPVVNWLVQDWNITLIRASMGVGVLGGYDSDDNAATANYNRVKTIVDAAIKNGIYVLVDYHAHDANLKVDKAKTFFGSIAKEYGSCPNVIWEIWNEPNLQNGSGPDGEDTWGDIKSYADQIIPIIRQHSNNLIVVGTPTWSQRVDIAAKDPLSDSNVAYTFHFYSGTHKDSVRAFAREAVDSGIAIFATEFGMTISDGGSDGLIDSVETKIWLDWADSNGISWANWSIVDKGEASAALKSNVSAEGGWTEENLTASGKWIRNRLRSRPVYDYSDIIPDDGKSLPGLIEAESFVTKSEKLTTEQTSDAGGGQNLGYTTDGAWAEYSVNVRRAGDYTAKLRVAAEANYGGKITLKFNNEVKATWNVNGTGGWQTWASTDTCEKFNLPAGEIKCRIEWSGTASSLINLNWIEFRQVVEPIAVLNRNIMNQNLIRNINIQKGSISFTASAELTGITLLSISGKVLCSMFVRPGHIQLPIGTGLYLLRLQNRKGVISTMKVMGAIR